LTLLDGWQKAHLACKKAYATEQILAISGLNFTILWGHVGRYCCL